MNKKLSLYFSITILFAFVICFKVSAQSTGCDRTCLSDMLDTYLHAVITHDPSAAPLFSGFRQTENAVVVKPGDGMWRSATALGMVQRRFLDPVTGQAVYFGMVQEGDNPAITNVRIRVESNMITEAEWYIGRKGDPGINGPADDQGQGANLFSPDNLTDNPPPKRVVQRKERLSRAALIAIANSYFDGITSHDGSIIQAHPGCNRFENGFQTTGRPLPEERKNDGYQGRSDCTSGMGGFSIALVAGRRFPLVDEQAQVVLGTAIFLRQPGSERRRNCFAELFIIDGGLIRRIYAAMFYPEAAKPVPNWPPYDGHFPLPASFSTD